MNNYALIGGKLIDVFLAETSRLAVSAVGRQDLFEDVYQELWCVALSRPDLTDRETIKAHHQANGNLDAVDDPEQHYGAAKLLKLEAQRIAREIAGEGIERPVEARYTSKDVSRLLKDWDTLPEVVRLALDSGRMPAQWRTALERRYRNGEKANAVGNNLIQRGRDRLVEIIESGVAPGQDASPEAVAREGWGPALRPAGFKQARYSEPTQEEYLTALLTPEELDQDTETSGGSQSLSDALRVVSEAVSADSTDDEITEFLCGPSSMVRRTAVERTSWLRKYYDIEPDLFVWGVAGRCTSPALEMLIGGLTEDEHHALQVRYNPDAPSKLKRTLEREGIAVLNSLRQSMGAQAGKGMGK